MQIFLTIVSGVAVFIIGQAILNFVLQPIKDFNKERMDTSYLLLFYQAKITNAANSNPKAPDDIKEMAASLVSTMSQIPFYRFLVWSRVFGLPTQQAVFEAARELNMIAYSTGRLVAALRFGVHGETPFAVKRCARRPVGSEIGSGAPLDADTFALLGLDKLNNNIVGDHSHCEPVDLWNGAAKCFRRRSAGIGG